MAVIDLSKLQTEAQNPRSARIDQVSTLELCGIINTEDDICSRAVRQCLPVIAAAIDNLSERVRGGGRVIYVGAGTSGRLGVLDASEIPPTYSVPASQFVGLIAGGDAAIRLAQEGAEDSWEGAEKDMRAQNLDPNRDSLIGIAASGRTPYVLSCLSFAKGLGCTTVGLACCEPSPMGDAGTVDFMITPITGPEVVTGSTRMKAGTATKLALNMLSTGIMIKVGKTYGNLMVDMKPSNAKLIARSRGMIRTVCGPLAPESDDELHALLRECNGSVKLAMTCLKLGLPIQESKACLEVAGGTLAEAIRRQNLRAGARSGEANSSDLCLCVDGGGTKCLAVIMNPRGQLFEGLGRPYSNIQDVTAAIHDAMQQAFKELQRHCKEYQSQSLDSTRFAAVWVGLAGYGRPQNKKAVDEALSSLLQLPLGLELRVTNDIDLHAAVMYMRQDVKFAITLVAGTGSVAMSYERRGEQIICTGRSGGWGYVLGDAGSGFDIGRQAIRVALAELDQNASGGGLSAFSKSVLAHFALAEGSGVSTSALLGAILLPTVAGADSRATRSRVASLAPVVLSYGGDSKEVRKIIISGATALADEVQALLSSRKMDASSSLLLVGGGVLIRSGSYREAVLTALRDRGVAFQSVTEIDSPAQCGAQALRARASRPVESRIGVAKL